MPVEATSDNQYYLDGLCWSFEGEPFEDRDKFEEAVREAQLRILGNADDWLPLEMLVHDTRIRIRFDVCNIEENFELEVELFSSVPNGFTALDIMFQLHNNVTPLLRRHQDWHVFFEGLCTNPAWQEPGKPHLYLLNLGS
jgi:hypothetical protein